MEREMGRGRVLDSKVLLPHFRESFFVLRRIIYSRMLYAD
jgi:hypothetical protein